MVKAAYESTGVGWIPYINTGDPIGYSEGAQNTYNGFRQYSAKCYLFGDNVTAWNHAITEKLLVARKNVTGVRVLRNSGDRETVDCGLMAKKEVIVSSGVQGSAKLLLLR